MNSDRVSHLATRPARVGLRRALAALLTILAVCAPAAAQWGPDEVVPAGGKSKLIEHLSAARQRKVLKDISENGGGPFPVGASVFAARRKGGRRVYVVKYQTDNPCGRRYELYRKTSGRYERLLMLECVRALYLTPHTNGYSYIFTKGYPDWTYMTGDEPERYYAVFKFKSEEDRYAEKVCKVTGPGGLAEIPCSGRGVVSP